jgi:phage terminase small subunit
VLTNKQRAFIAEYLKDFNATRAALRAGYSKKTARFIGAENLTKPYIAEKISENLAERAMGADEVLARMSAMARGSAEDYLTIDEYGHTSIDLPRMKAEGKMHLVKKYKVTKQSVELELYDAQSALLTLGKHHGLWVDKDTADWRKEIIALLKAERITPEQVRAEVGEELARDLFKSAGISTVAD